MSEATFLNGWERERGTHWLFSIHRLDWWTLSVGHCLCPSVGPIREVVNCRLPDTSQKLEGWRELRDSAMPVLYLLRLQHGLVLRLLHRLGIRHELWHWLCVYSRFKGGKWICRSRALKIPRPELIIWPLNLKDDNQNLTNPLGALRSLPWPPWPFCCSSSFSTFQSVHSLVLSELGLLWGVPQMDRLL